MRTAGPAFGAPGRRIAIAGTVAGVLAVAGVGVVAARTATPGESPGRPIAVDEATIHLNDGSPAAPRTGTNPVSRPNSPSGGPSGVNAVGTNPGSAGGSDGVDGTGAGPTSGGNATHVLAAPTITALSPATGPVTGGTTMTIHGTHFMRNAKVFFNNLRAQQVTRVSSTELRIVTPTAQSVAVSTAFAQLHGLHVAVHVVTKGGTSTTGVSSRYTYI